MITDKIVSLSREDLNKLKILEQELYAEIKDVEKTVALTEEKCTAITQRIPEIIELEKTEKDRVINVYILMQFQKRQLSTVHRISKFHVFLALITDFTIKISN